MNTQQDTKPLRIWQQNVAKSLTAQHDLLSRAHSKDWDIIALQEPYIDHLNLTRAGQSWNVIYPSNKGLNGQAHIRSIILVNTNIHSEQISQIGIQSSDITAIQFNTNTRPVIIINVYNDNTHSRAIDTISRAWETHKNTWLANPNTEIVVLGDFNRHHST